MNDLYLARNRNDNVVLFTAPPEWSCESWVIWKIRNGLTEGCNRGIRIEERFGYRYPVERGAYIKCKLSLDLASVVHADAEEAVTK